MVREASGPPYSQTEARINARFPRERLARQAAVEMEQAGVKCTVPVWEQCTLIRPWLLQVTCPHDLSDGVDPVEQARLLILRTVHRYDGVVLDDVPEHVVVPGVSHSQRPGGAPFVGQLPRRVVAEHERDLTGKASDYDVPLPGLMLRQSRTIRALLYVAPTADPYGNDEIGRCRARARQRGWTIVDVYVDNYTGTAWKRMRADLDAGIADAVVVLSPKSTDRVAGDLLVGLADDFGLAVSTVYAEPS